MIEIEEKPETDEETMLKIFLQLMDFVKEKANELNLSKRNRKEVAKTLYENHKDEIRERFLIEDEDIIQETIEKTLILMGASASRR